MLEVPRGNHGDNIAVTEGLTSCDSYNSRILVILVIEFVFSKFAILCLVCLWTMLPDKACEIAGHTPQRWNKSKSSKCCCHLVIYKRWSNLSENESRLSRRLCDDNCSLGDKKLLKGVNLSKTASDEHMCSKVCRIGFACVVIISASSSSLTTHFMIVLSFCFKRTQKK